MKLRTRITVSTLIVVALVTVSSVIYFVERERSAAVMRLGDTIEQDAHLLEIVTPGPLYDGHIGQLNAVSRKTAATSQSPNGAKPRLGAAVASNAIFPSFAGATIWVRSASPIPQGTSRSGWRARATRWPGSPSC